MIKQLPLEKVYIITRCFQERFMGQMEAVGRQLLDHVPFEESSRADAQGRDRKVGFWHQSWQVHGGQVLTIQKKKWISQLILRQDVTKSILQNILGFSGSP